MELLDTLQRPLRDLRISVTDRCNFRCTYCMPKEGMQWQPRDEILTFEEIVRLAAVFVDRFGFDSIRLTGGEPTMRAHLPGLVARLSGLGVDLAMTTNGATLATSAAALADAGLRRINISLDSLRAERFRAMTNRDALHDVLAGIDAAVAAGLSPVKINVVAMAGVNDDELLDFARFGRDRGVEVRFIEFMPLDAQGEWTAGQVLTAADIVAAIGAEFPLEAGGREHDPAYLYRYVDGRGAFGVIASVSEPFCGSCDRVRLTADGKLRNCLFSTSEVDLRAILRDGGSDDDVAGAIADCVASKAAGHGIGTPAFIRPGRSMSQIGG